MEENDQNEAPENILLGEDFSLIDDCNWAIIFW